MMAWGLIDRSSMIDEVFVVLRPENFDTEGGLRISPKPQSLPKVVKDRSKELLEVTKCAHKRGPLIWGDKKMLALFAIFLVTLLIAMVTIQIYRAVSGWQGFNSVVVARRRTPGAKLRPQQGFVSLKGLISQFATARPKIKSVKLRKSTGTIKAPWGW